MSITRFIVTFMILCGTIAPLHAGESKVKSSQIPDIIRPAIEQIKDSKTPVMLPVWLPSNCKGPIGTGTGPFQDGYEIWLGTCSADTTLFVSGGKGKATRTKRSFKLKNGKTAYIQNLKDFCMEWSDKECVYRVGYPSRGSKSDIEILCKIADSMKLVSVAAN
ncbi:hypothetical protein KA183_13300 [bacterium]|nr:hypothetical protein [bacterium]QQR57696.1 MAG: hypothetical protein IPG59_22440 [Candidatus Melainabacteria bacterium]